MTCNIVWYLVSIIQLGGGYLFGLPVGFVADSIGAAIGAGAAFLLGRTVSFWTLVMVFKQYLKENQFFRIWNQKCVILQIIILLHSLSINEGKNLACLIVTIVFSLEMHISLLFSLPLSLWFIISLSVDLSLKLPCRLVDHLLSQSWRIIHSSAQLQLPFGSLDLRSVICLNHMWLFQMERFLIDMCICSCFLLQNSWQLKLLMNFKMRYSSYLSILLEVNITLLLLDALVHEWQLTLNSLPKEVIKRDISFHFSILEVQ